MSYQVLARKWRPRSFADMVGQRHVLQVLDHALTKNKLHHAYLFSGTRGVGKTTLARILAQCFNCEQGVSATPCGQCSTCTAVHQGRFVDLIEVDAASRAKVEETRDLMDNVQYMPTSGRYKVYLIDEIHMFSSHSFNALLKTLEEPPPHVKFLLATTEPEKLPATILSRCLQLNLRQLSIEQISTQLIKIVQAEQVSYDDASIRLLARSAQGSMRDALSLLDQAISNGSGQLEEAQVRHMLGTVATHDLTALVTALIKQDGGALFDAAEKMAAYNPDYQTVLTELLYLFHKAAVTQVLSGKEGRRRSESTGDSEPLRLLADGLDKEDIQLYYQIALNGRDDLAIVPDQRVGFEMILVRMLAFRIGTAPSFNDQGPPPTTDKGEVTTTPTEQPQKGREQQKVVAANCTEWQDIFEQMPLTGLVKELASHCVLQSRDTDKITLALRPIYQNLLSDIQKKRLEDAVNKYFGANIKLFIDIKEFDQDSPAQIKCRESEEKKKSAFESLKQNGVVQALIDNFDAHIDADSITVK